MRRLGLAIEVDLALGVSRDEAKADMLALADITGATIQAKFNDSKLLVFPDGKALSIPDNPKNKVEVF